MISKQFKTIDEQIKILREKGLIIADEEYAKQVLLRENYFFLSGYRHLLSEEYNNNKFLPNVRFEELYSMFLFDRNIRNIIFKYLLVIENNLKSIMSYILSRKYGYKEKEYLKAKNYTSDKDKQNQIADLLSKMKRQIRINGPQHSATNHYSEHYGYIPLWILVKVLSFGIISEFYTILKKEDQKEIAQLYNIDVKDMHNYLPLLANYRNLCAHEDILYENKTQKSIDDTIFHKLLNIPKVEDEYIYGKNDIFALIIILKQMLTKNDFKNLILELENSIETLNYNLTSIKVGKVLNKIGFPINWKNIINIERNEDNE